MNKDIQEAGLEYIAAGLSVMPFKASKAPAMETWDKDKAYTQEEFILLASNPEAVDIGVIAGPSSGGLEVLDIDTKNDPPGKIWYEYSDHLRDNLPDLYRRLIIATTPSGGLNRGHHIYYKTTVTEGSKKLALTERGETIIETRGYGACAVVPPGKDREYIQGNIMEAPLITEEERATLHGIAASLTRKPQREEPPREIRKRHTNQTIGSTPWGDYNDRVRLLDLLEQEGWTSTGQRGNKVFVKRPGDSTATNSGNILDSLLWVWSTSTNLPSEKALTAFDVYKYLHHNGDGTAAARELRRQGYGSQSQYTAPEVVHKIGVGVTGTKPGIDQEEQLAVVGGILDVKQIQEKGIRTIYIDHAPNTSEEEIYAVLDSLSTHTASSIYTREVDPTTGEVGEPQRPEVYRLEQVLKPYTDKAPTDQDIDQILDRIQAVTETIGDPIARERFIGTVVRLPLWDQIGVVVKTLRGKLHEATNRAAKIAAQQETGRLWDQIGELLEDGASLKEIEKLTKRLYKVTTRAAAPSGVSIATLEDIYTDIANREEGLRIGIEEIDKHGFRFNPGQFSIIGARTHNGKTFLLVYAAVYAAIHYPDRTFIYAGYEERPDQLYERILKVVAGQSFTTEEIQAALKGEQHRPILAHAIYTVNTLLSTGRLVLTENQPTIESLQEYVAKIREKGEQLGGIYIDYVQRIKTSRNSDGIREKNVYISEALKDLALDNNTPVIAAAQLNREAVGKERPQLSQIKESGNLEEDCANALILQAPGWSTPDEFGDTLDYTDFIIDIQKARMKAPLKSFSLGAYRSRGRVVGSSHTATHPWTLKDSKPTPQPDKADNQVPF